MSSANTSPDGDPLPTQPACDLPSTESLLEICRDLHHKITTFLDLASTDERIRATQARTRTSLDVIRDALTRYSPAELSLSYNGGKDCLVLLILYLSILPSLPASKLASLPPLLPAVYILPPSPFPQVSTFVAQTSTRYHLRLTHYSLPMREAFRTHLDRHPHIRAVMVGTRRTDPHGSQLTFFDETDGGWPRFMRVHPVLEWRYAEVWIFLRCLHIPYCELYDRGYTSLGGTNDTRPNPALRRERPPAEEDRLSPETGAGEYRPAYELEDDSLERAGRFS